MTLRRPVPKVLAVAACGLLAGCIGPARPPAPGPAATLSTAPAAVPASATAFADQARVMPAAAVGLPLAAPAAESLEPRPDLAALVRLASENNPAVKQA